MNMQDNLSGLEIPYINLPGIPYPGDAVPYLNNLSPIGIQTNPWPHYNNSVNANFSIAHNGNAILLKYAVREHFLKACATTNGNIHRDSCVEFFVDFEGNGEYYNLEFNSLGWCKIGFGKNDREDRILLSPNLVELIASKSEINSAITDNVRTFTWEIVLVIPALVFCYSSFSKFNGLKARGNFYKCGDELPKPHYLVWKNIDAKKPDFHRPECFGRLEFA